MRACNPDRGLFCSTAIMSCAGWVGLLLALAPPAAAADAGAAKTAYEKGKACLDKKDYDAALAAFDEAIRLDPKDAKSYVGRGSAYDRKNEYDKAIADESEAIQLDPRNVEAYCERGIAYSD